MKSSLLAIILAVVLFGGFYYFNPGGSSLGGTPSAGAPDSSDATAQIQKSTSTATNFDECIAEGNKPLPDAPDKCLTTSGHIFIKGVVE